MVWGAGYRYTHEVDRNLSLVRFLPSVLDQSLYNGFAQDAIMQADTSGSKARFILFS